MIGYAKDVKDNVQLCTSEKLNEALDSSKVAEVCQSIAEALKKYQQGEMTKEDFEALKGRMKKQLPILTLHATFQNGRRKNDEAIPSGLSMYDLDHIADPRAKWAEIESRKEELGIVLSHITPSTEGLRLAFVMPQGMSLAEAQAWMAEQLGVEMVSLEEMFSRCAVISNHLANNAQTRGMLNYDLFSKMEPHATFINTGRGAQVVEADLVRALTERPDLTAVLDVTFPEPPEAGHAFYTLPNCILTPHIAGSIGDEVVRMAEYMAEECHAWLTHTPPRYEVTASMLATMA